MDSEDEVKVCDICGNNKSMGKFIFVDGEEPINVCSSCYDLQIKKFGYSMRVE